MEIISSFKVILSILIFVAVFCAPGLLFKMINKDETSKTLGNKVIGFWSVIAGCALIIFLGYDVLMDSNFLNNELLSKIFMMVIGFALINFGWYLIQGGLIVDIEDSDKE